MPAAIFPGTFDPPTLGHLNIIERAAQIFQPLYVAVGFSLLKPDSIFTAQEKVDLLRKMTASIPHVEVIIFEGLLVDLSQQLNVRLIIRAVRNFADFEYETIQASMNNQMAGLETLYFAADEKYRQISSSLVREIAAYNKRLHAFIPASIEQEVFERLSRSVKP